MAYKSAYDNKIILNFPIDVSFKSTNPFGWPRIVLSVILLMFDILIVKMTSNCRFTGWTLLVAMW
jgi:hypothetical protein